MILLQCLSLFLAVTVLQCFASGPYQPTWESLDSRPLPQWFDDAKIGIFIHWGVFSVPALHGSNFWNVWQSSKPGDFYYDFMKKNYRDDWTYADFAKGFTAEMFDADKWISLFKDAGAKYVCQCMLVLIIHNLVSSSS